MTLNEWIIEAGFSVGLLINALLFIPQILAIYRAKSAKGVTFFGFNLIQLFTMFHGLIKKDYLLTLGYLLSLITSGIVTALIIYYDYLPRNNR
jgi:MtN3 and saliva related transmembrane protein